MNLSEKFRRLRQMTAEEIKFRGRQRWRILQEQFGRGHKRAAAPWFDYWDPSLMGSHRLRQAFEARNFAQAASLLPKYFTSRKQPRFYFGQEVDALRAAHSSCFPARMDQLRAEADSICRHRFSIFAYPEISAGAQIPWQRDLVHEKQAAMEHWARVPYLDFAKAGDSKIVWEPNRHQHFFTLGQAFLLTGEERYAEECLAQWDDWLLANPYGLGINWASSLELAFRVWSWVWALHFLQGSEALTGDRIASYTKSIALHCEFIEHNLSTYFSPNTHLLGEGFSLFVAGLLFPELRGASSWLSTGRRVLLEEMERQVRPDGWHAEQSSYYHRYAVDFFQCTAILADRNGCGLPASYAAKLEKMYEVILHTRLPSGSQPMLGDADGGRLLPFSARPDPQHSQDQRGALSTGAVYFSRPDFRAAAGRFHEDTFWLLGSDTERQFNSLPAVSVECRSAVFRDAGYVVMRSGSPERHHMLLFDAGPQGMQGCGHGHADALSIICSAGGVDWLVDPGTFVYTSSRDWRAAFNGTRAHNTVVIDGLDQAEPVDFFKWRAVPKTRLEKWMASPSLEVALASHDGYMRLPQGVMHRRRILNCKSRYWLVTDELKGTGRHTAEFMFHFSPETQLAPQGRGCRARKDDQSFLLYSSEDSLEGEVVQGNEASRMGWYSADYGLKAPAPVFVAKRTFVDSLLVHWLLCPDGEGSEYDVGSTGKETTVACGSRVDVICQHVAAKGCGAGVTSDAELLYRSATPGSPTLALFNGCCVFEDGRQILEAEAMLDAFECSSAGEELRIFSSPRRAFRFFAPGAARIVLNGNEVPFSKIGDWIEVSQSE